MYSFYQCFWSLIDKPINWQRKQKQEKNGQLHLNEAMKIFTSDGCQHHVHTQYFETRMVGIQSIMKNKVKQN